MLVSLQGLISTCMVLSVVCHTVCNVKFRVAVRSVILAITPVWVCCHQAWHLPAHLNKLTPQGLRKRLVQEPVKGGWLGWAFKEPGSWGPDFMKL